MDLTIDNFVLKRLEAGNYRLTDDSKTLLSSNFWDLRDVRSNFDFLFLLIIGLSAIFLSYQNSKISSFLWFSFSSFLFTRWFIQTMAFRTASSALGLVSTLGGSYGLFTFITSSSVVSVIILLTVSLALLVSILELSILFIRKNGPLHEKNSENERTNYSLIIGGIIIIFLPLWFGPFFTNTSLITVLFYSLGMNVTWASSLLALLSLVLCSFFGVIFAFLLLPIDKITKNLELSKENGIEIGITLITLIIITLKYFSEIIDDVFITNLTWIGLIAAYIIYFASVGLILWKRKKVDTIWTNVFHLESKIKNNLKRYLRITVLLGCVIITIFPFWSFYTVADLRLEYFPINQEDSLSYYCNTSSTIIYGNGTIITMVHPVFLSQGIFPYDLNESHLIISHCLGDLLDDGTYTEMIGIVSINSTSPYTEVINDTCYFSLINKEVSLSCWELVITDNSVLQIEINNQLLQVGEEISLAFCVPSEEGELLDSVFTKFCINFILKDIIVQQSEGY
jgi:hypothetical protein